MPNHWSTTVNLSTPVSNSLTDLRRKHRKNLADPVFSLSTSCLLSALGSEDANHDAGLPFLTQTDGDAVASGRLPLHHVTRPSTSNTHLTSPQSRHQSRPIHPSHQQSLRITYPKKNRLQADQLLPSKQASSSSDFQPQVSRIISQHSHNTHTVDHPH